MNLIDPSYFIGEINIAGTDRLEVLDSLNALISKYESMFLRDVLGIELSNLFVAGLPYQFPTLLDQRYLYLRDGVAFIVNGITYRWRGFVEEKNDAIKKRSIIANYIYYWYLRDVNTFQTPVGETSALTHNSVTDSPDVKMTRAWNEMVDGVSELRFFLQQNSIMYPEYQTVITPASYFQKLNIFGI